MALHAVHDVGLILLNQFGAMIVADHLARQFLGTPGAFLGRRRPVYDLLDETGRPRPPNQTFLEAKTNEPLEVTRGIRWPNSDRFHWVRATYIKQSDLQAEVLITRLVEPTPRQRGWNCSACGRAVSAVAEWNDRELCIPCWAKTSQRLNNLALGLELVE